MNDARHEILDILGSRPLLSSKEIQEALHSGMGYATVKRVLERLVVEQLVAATGRSRSTKYRIGPAYRLLNEVDLEAYFQQEIDERKIVERYDHELIPVVLGAVSLFTPDESERLEALQAAFTDHISGLSPMHYAKERSASR